MLMPLLVDLLMKTEGLSIGAKREIVQDKDGSLGKGSSVSSSDFTKHDYKLCKDIRVC